MIIVKQTANALWQCFANPAFEMLYSRIRLLLKDLAAYRGDNDEWILFDDNKVPRQKEITNSDYIDPLTKRIYQNQDVNSVTLHDDDGLYYLGDGTVVYPAYTYILGTKIKQIIADWEKISESITDEKTGKAAVDLIGDMYVYELTKEQIEAMVIATGWQEADQ